jgi:hypothetical protein
MPRGLDSLFSIFHIGFAADLLRYLPLFNSALPVSLTTTGMGQARWRLQAIMFGSL